MNKIHKTPSGRARPTRVLLADPHGLVLEALSTLLSPDHEVVACVRDGESAVREALRLKPDVVISEVHLPGMDGIEAARQIRQGCPLTRVVFLTGTRDAALAADGFAAGAAGFLLKTSSRDEFLAALREVENGHRALARDIREGRPENLPEHPERRGGGILSPRTEEVVRRLAGGLTMKQVGVALGISTRTVAFHKYRAMEQLGIDSSAGLVRFAVESGLLGDPVLPGAWTWRERQGSDDQPARARRLASFARQGAEGERASGRP